MDAVCLCARWPLTPVPDPRGRNGTPDAGGASAERRDPDEDAGEPERHGPRSSSYCSCFERPPRAMAEYPAPEAPFANTELILVEAKGEGES